MRNSLPTLVCVLLTTALASAQFATQAPGRTAAPPSSQTGGGLTLLLGSGGSDDCASAHAILGEGLFAFDNSSATTGVEGQNEALCFELGSSALQRDVWFTWTPSASGTAVVTTCGSALDTRLAAYPGSGCPVDGTSLACNDDACGPKFQPYQSRIQFPVVAGDSYMVQVGVHPGAPGGTGPLEFQVVPAPSHDDCATPTPIFGSGTFAFDLTWAITGSEGQAEGLCSSGGSSAVLQDLWYAWTADATGTALVRTCFQTNAHTKLAAYAGAGCPSPGSALACAADSCGFQSILNFDVTAGSTYTLQVGRSPSGFGPGVAGTFDVHIVPAQDCYTLDDGSSEGGLGLFAGGDVIMLNGFDAGAGDVLVGVEATYGHPSDPVPYDPGPIVIAVWDDPTDDFDPTDAVLVHTQNETAAAGSVATGVFQAFSLPAIPVRGVFFVGILFGDLASGEAAPSVDTSAPSGHRSWYTFASSGNGNLADLTQNSAGGPFSLDSNVMHGRFLLRAVAHSCSPEVGTPFCAGDGTASPCPCGNPGDPGRGCANGVEPGGALLAGAGSASLSAADLVLRAASLPPQQFGTYIQGSSQVAGGAGVVFGDGLRCVGGAVVRLQQRPSDGHGLSHTTIDLGARGGASPGDTRTYQLWYRDPQSSPCGQNFNLTQGLELTWVP